MGSKRFITAALLVGAMAMPAMAQFDVDDEISDLGVWTSVGIEKKITKKFSGLII